MPEGIPVSKRIFDLVITSLGLIIILPLMLVLPPLVWLFLGSPVLFRQPRPGYKGRPFITYKFRTMTNHTGPDGSLLPDDQRITTFGRFLRSTSLQRPAR
jgi:lipopolysaccharide/colanic/teichoic acid biosynthesis glycosyltransferase